MDKDVLDLPEFLERVQDDKELLLELFDIYIQDFKDKRLALKEAVAANDFEQIKNLAHSLKGASGNISAKLLRVTFLKFEEMGKNQNLASASETLALMDQQFQDLLNRIATVKQQLQK